MKKEMNSKEPAESIYSPSDSSKNSQEQPNKGSERYRKLREKGLSDKGIELILELESVETPEDQKKT